MPSNRSSCESTGVGCSRRSSAAPSRETRAARIFVPPTSTPVTRSAFTRGGYHSRPDGRRGEALPRLQGWAVEGEAPHATPARAPSEVGRILTGREEKEEASPQAPPLRPVVRDPARPVPRLADRVVAGQLLLVP